MSDNMSNLPDTAETEAVVTRKKGLSFGRVLLIIVIAVFALVNIWTFIELLKIDLLVASVEINQQQVDLFESETYTLYADVRSYGLSETLGLTEADVVWSSDNSEVVAVSDDGAIYAVAPGTAVITAAESRSDLSASCTVTVHSLTDILLNCQQCTLGTGESFVLSASVGSGEPADSFEYSVSDPSVLSVDASGNITALAPGSASVSVSARGFTSSECIITVCNAPTVITLNTPHTDICVGESRTLVVSCGDAEYCSAYTFSSSDTSVLSVDSDGKLKGEAKGDAVITITAYNGVSQSFEYHVTAAPKSVELNSSKLTVFSGCSESLIPEDSTGSCLEYYYTTSDASIASVDENGVITGHNCGTATITCTSFNGESASCAVTVKIVQYTVPYTSATLQQNIDALASSYPDLIKTEVIGKSVLGTDISLIKIGTGERKALIAAGMHSREGIGVTFTMRCIEEYAKAFYSKSGKYGSYNVRDMLSEFTLYIVPLMNPDGLDIVNTGINPVYDGFNEAEFDRPKYKNNANGVNLNRNFPFMWGFTSEKESVNLSTPDALSYAGAQVASEPETQAMMALCNANEFEWFLDVHCRGNLIYYQDQFNEVKEADNRLASRLARKCGFTLTDQSTAYEVSGGFENWFRQEFGKPGICIELVHSEYSYVVNDSFEKKLSWSKTKYAFLIGMLD